MTTRLGVGVIAFMCTLVCAIAASFAVFEMVDKVNERLPVEQQFAPLWWHWSKSRRLASEYKRLYPGGNLSRKSRALAVLMFSCVLVSAWCFGIFGR